MALPPRGAAVFVSLSGEAGSPFPPYRTQGNVFNSFIQIGDPALNEPKAPSQPSFWGSQVWFSNYPEDAVAKVHLGLLGSLGNSDWPTAYDLNVTGGNLLYMEGFTGNVEVITTFPNNIVYSYDPTPAPGPADPVPDPNGGTGNTTTTYTLTWGGSGALPAISFLPRWHTDTAYDISTIGTLSSVTNGYCPLFNSYYYITPGASLYGRAFSIDVTVTNQQSKVLNEQTSLYEYYDFAQTTFSYKQTAKVKLKLSQLCGTTSCWDNGTVITGTVSFQGLDVTTEPVGNPTDSIYGFSGMYANTGSTVTAAGSQSFSVTVSSSYTPVEITIPAVSNKITFINDFRIDSITRPT
jgi:hypothetical protein